MNARARQREARREALRAQCTRQRERLAASLDTVQHHLQPIDRGLSTLQVLRRTPMLLGGIAAALAALMAMLSAGRVRRPTLGRFSWLLPLAGPLLNMLERWWQERRSTAPSRSVSETPRPDHP